MRRRGEQITAVNRSRITDEPRVLIIWSAADREAIDGLAKDEALDGPIKTRRICCHRWDTLAEALDWAQQWTKADERGLEVWLTFDGAERVRQNNYRLRLEEYKPPTDWKDEFQLLPPLHLHTRYKPGCVSDAVGVDAHSYPRARRPATPWYVKRIVESARAKGDKAHPLNAAILQKYDERKRRQALEDAAYASARRDALMDVDLATACIEDDDIKMLPSEPVASTSHHTGVRGRPSDSASWSLPARPPSKAVEDAFDVNEYWADAKAACTDNTTRNLAAQPIYPVFLDGIGDAQTSPGHPIVVLDQLIVAAVSRTPGNRFHLVLSTTSNLFSCQYLGQYELVTIDKLLWTDIKELDELKRLTLQRQLLDDKLHDRFGGSSVQDRAGLTSTDLPSIVKVPKAAARTQSGRDWILKDWCREHKTRLSDLQAVTFADLKRGYGTTEGVEEAIRAGLLEGLHYAVLKCVGHDDVELRHILAQHLASREQSKPITKTREPTLNQLLSQSLTADDSE